MKDTQEILILYLADELEPQDRLELEQRLAAEPALAAELEELRSSLDLVRESAQGDPGSGYWRSFYSRLQPKLHHTSFWEKLADLLKPGSGMQFAGLAGALAVIFIVVSLLLAQTFFHTEPIPTVTETKVSIKRTEGVLEHIVSNHLERSRLLLQELVNIPTGGPEMTELLADTRNRSEKLLSDNRTYRLAAERQDDKELAGLLSDLELVLVEIANLDPDVAEYAIPTVKRIIRSKNLLIKIEIINLNEQEDKAPNREEA